MIAPLPLKPGDKIGLIAPSRNVNQDNLTEPVSMIESWGYQVTFGKNLYDKHYQFAGKDEDNGDRKNNAVINSVGFVIGFSLVFILLGALSGSVGAFLFRNAKAVNIIFGSILIILGLNYTGILKIGFLNATRKFSFNHKSLGIFSSILFGMVFSIGWTPCIGTFLGSALMLAANSGTVWKGILMLAVFSLGLGIPFILSALLIQQLKSTFDFIKRNYKIINAVSGILLIVLGILMILGYFGF